MKYFFKSVITWSFWRYALFSRAGAASLLACIGVLYLFMELMDFLDIYTHDKYSKLAIIPIGVAAVIYVVASRRPLTKFTYKLPGRDVRIEVKIADLFDENADIVVSTNTTFDTDMSARLISPESLQGQFSLRFFQGDTNFLDQQITQGLAGVSGSTRADPPGKPTEYPMGTVARVSSGNNDFYLLAMAKLNKQGNASSSMRDIEDALIGLWTYISARGELRPIAMPVIGTGRGRVDISRKKMIERVVQSFADASANGVISNKLSLVVRPADADNFGVNLFEIRDYLIRSIH